MKTEKILSLENHSWSLAATRKENINEEREYNYHRLTPPSNLGVKNIQKISKAMESINTIRK